jgi:hypothetical protein
MRRGCATIPALLLILTPCLGVASTVDATPGDCTTNSPGAAIRVAVAASRTAGVAPLAVFFDARETTSGDTAQPFHDLEYRWDFGDPASGVWAHGSRPDRSSRNEATGAVAAHVFERPGNYRIAVSVTNGGHVARNTCLLITVRDPDAFFIGDRTVCLSATGNFEGCPAGARRVFEPRQNFSAVLSERAANGRRLLFRRGETWLAPVPGVLRTSGPGIIGSFGTGPRPKIQATSNSDTALLQISSSSSPGIRDWRVMDLEFDGNGHGSRHAIRAEGAFDQLTLLRLDMHDVRNGLLMGNHHLDLHNRSQRSAGHTLWDQLALVDSTTSNIAGSSGAYSIYVSARRFMLLGNHFNNSGGGEHTVRLPSIVAGVIANNTMQGQGSSAGGKHAFTLRAAVHGSSGVEGGEDTQWIMVSDNKFVGTRGSDWTVTYQPQASADERILDVITERNWFVAGGAEAGTQFALVLFARNQTIRNNLFDTTGGRAHGAIQVHDGLSVGSNGINIFNNSFIANDPGKEFIGISARPAAEGVVVRNNLAFAPKDNQARMIAGPADASHNSSDTQVKRADPRFSERTPTSPSGWKPMNGSYAIGAGTLVPVWSDFFLRSRPPHHLGAILP